MTLKDYLAKIAKISVNPLTYGVHLATSGKKPLEGALKEYLIYCYKHKISPSQAVEEWI